VTKERNYDIIELSIVYVLIFIRCMRIVHSVNNTDTVGSMMNEYICLKQKHII